MTIAAGSVVVYCGVVYAVREVRGDRLVLARGDEPPRIVSMPNCMVMQPAAPRSLFEDDGA